MKSDKDVTLDVDAHLVETSKANALFSSKVPESELLTKIVTPLK